MNAAPEETAKLHFIRTLFADLFGDDAYLAGQVKQAIEAALAEEESGTDTTESFTKAAVLLLQNHFRRRPSHGFAHWEAPTRKNGFDSLWARQELIALFKKLAPYPTSTVLITGLRPSIQGEGKRWNRALQSEYAEAVAFIQELARNWSTRSAEVTLLFF